MSDFCLGVDVSSGLPIESELVSHADAVFGCECCIGAHFSSGLPRDSPLEDDFLFSTKTGEGTEISDVDSIGIGFSAYEVEGIGSAFTGGRSGNSSDPRLDDPRYLKIMTFFVQLTLDTRY